MSALDSPADVERVARRLNLIVQDLTLLDHRLRAARWGDDQLEDLEHAAAQIRQCRDLLLRHARRWRRWPLGGEE